MARHKIRLFTWFDGRLFTDNQEADTLEEAKTLARGRGPHSFKIFDGDTGEVLHSEICDPTAPQVPDYA